MNSSAASSRLVSLDAFRGATIAAMILVNDPGDWQNVYAQLQHSRWDGWTFTDWIFPFFLFIVGVAMVYSFGKRKESGAGTAALSIKIVRRTLIIFALGLFLNAFPSFDLQTVRIPGVLQRIAVCYLVTSIILLHAGIRAQVLWTVGLLAGYWLLVKLVPVPGYGAGIMEPKGSLCWYVDSTLLAGHTWYFAPTEGFDPEGIVSTIPAIASTLSGVLAGHLLRSERTREEKTILMFVTGLLLLLAGAILDMWLPINKNMWTSTYSIFMTGWALVCLGVFYWLIDVKGYRRWATAFVIFGMNAIAIYFLAELLASILWALKVSGPGGTAMMLHTFIYDSIFLHLASSTNASLLFAIAFVLVMFAVAWAMWRRRIFLKV